MGTATQYVTNGLYVPHSGIQSLSLNNNAWTETWTYNSRLQPTNITVGSALTLALDYSLASDTTKNNGNLGTETITRAGYSTSWVQSFTYDGLNRIGFAGETGWSDTYSYDQFGNRWVSAHTGPSLDTYTPQNSTNYDGGNHLYIQTMKYDNDGNATQVGGYGFA
jgi:hypothetical protein